MSGAAQARSAEPAYQFPIREATQIIDRNWLLVDAELRLVLGVMRRNGFGANQPYPEKDWMRETHMSPRSRLTAMRGLREKKILHVEGEGDHARMGVDIRGWQEFVRQTPPDFKPRTAGRTESKPPEPKLHAECRERGCQMLKLAAIGPCNSDVTAESYKMTFVDAAGLKQAVTQPVAQRDQANLQPATAKKPAVAESLPHAAAGDSQGESERAWAKTLSTIRSIFPAVTFLVVLRIIAACKALDPSEFTDSELAEAVAQAWVWNAGYQKRPGLFEKTVPEALVFLRARRKRGPPERSAPVCAKCGASGFTGGANWRTLSDIPKLIAAGHKPCDCRSSEIVRDCIAHPEDFRDA